MLTCPNVVDDDPVPTVIRVEFGCSGYIAGPPRHRLRIDRRVLYLFLPFQPGICLGGGVARQHALRHGRLNPVCHCIHLLLSVAIWDFSIVIVSSFCFSDWTTRTTGQLYWNEILTINHSAGVNKHGTTA